jgi:phage shock protein C
MSKKLQRREGLLLGVCAGIGEHLGISPIIVRIVWILLTPFSIGINIVIYVIAALALPKEDSGSTIAEKSCKNCGTQNILTGQFCKSCGKPI